MTVRKNRFLDFGPFRVDVERQQLLRDGSGIFIPPKAFEALLLLISSRGQVVHKDDLMQALWPDTFVEEGNLTQNIFLLRKALGDTKDGPRYIETIPRRGYRFLADVRESYGPFSSGP